jgi:FG-GAP-like repeat
MQTKPRFGLTLRCRRWAATVVAVVLTVPLMGGGAGVGPPAASAATSSAVTVARDGASAAAAARASGRRVEVLGRRTEAAQVYANPSGTFTLEQHNQPQRVRRGDQWVPIDTTLRVLPDGTVAPVAAVGDVVFSGGGDGPLVRARPEGRAVGLVWPGRLPKPTLDGDAATYADVLPGIDLTVRALANGFSHVLVVKSAAAAKDPRLRRVAFSVTGSGLSVRRRGNGSLSVVDGAGELVLGAGTPLMWDAGGGAKRSDVRAAVTGAREAPMAVEAGGGGFTLVPDARVLEDPGTRYPLFIDPTWTFGRLAWTSVYKRYPGTSYWNREQIAWDDPQKGVVKAGWASDENQTVRSFFRMDTSWLIPTVVTRATFRITESWAWSCAPRTLELGQTGPISPATTWSNQPVWIRTVGSSYSAKGYEPGGCGDGPVEMDATAAVQEAAEYNWPDVTLGLRANEGDTFAWRRMRLDAVLIVDFNTYPDVASGLYADINLPCATGPGRPATNTAPTLWANGSDRDGGNLRIEFEWWDTGGSRIGSQVVGWLGNGSRFSAVIPGSVLQDGRVYSWRARVGDTGELWGGWSGFCEFGYDTDPPDSLPRVASSSFPEGGTGLPTGQRGEFTFTSTDPEVTGYRYGLTESTTSYVAAGSDSSRSATVPLTVWTDNPSLLYVYSVDRAGNRSPNYYRYDFFADAGAQRPPGVEGDLDGDGLADVIAFQQRDADESALVTLASKGTGFYSMLRAWESGPNTNFRLGMIQPVRGDFNGDGRTDVAMLRDEGDVNITAWVFHAAGTSYRVPAAPAWTCTPGCWFLHSGRTTAGDINGDGKDDLVHFHGYPGARTRTFVFYGTTDGVAPPVVVFDSGDGGWDVSRSREVVGDFNGDGRDDIGSFQDHGTFTRLLIARGTATGISPWEFAQDGAWWWRYSKEVVGDFNGDGKDDIALFHDYSNAHTKVVVGHGTATGISAWMQYWNSGPGQWEWSQIKPTAGDVNGDGRSDVIAAYGYGDSTGLWVFSGNATGGVSTPVVKWDSGAPDSGGSGLDWSRALFL